MKDEMTFKEYNELNCNNILKISKKIIYMFLIILIGGILIISKLNYYEYKKVLLFSEGENIYKTLININELDKINNKKKIIINNKEYQYKIIKMDEEIIIDNNTYYKYIYLNIDLSNRYNLKNNVINSKIVINKQNIYKRLINL